MPMRIAGVGAVRREVLDRMLILGGRHLQAVLTEYVDYYNGHRPHYALGQAPPLESAGSAICMSSRGVLRRDRLGGLVMSTRRSYEVTE
jgi:putative transposase